MLINNFVFRSYLRLSCLIYVEIIQCIWKSFQMEEEEMQRLYNQEQEISRQRILLEMEREKMAEEEEKKR